MRSAIIYVAFAALAAANPLPQEFSWSDIEAADPIPTVTIPIVNIEAKATTVSYAEAAAASTIAAEVASGGIMSVNKRNEIVRRGTCAAQAAGSGPVPSTDSAAAFMADPDFAQAANSAITPAGYVNTFTNQGASNNAYGYMGYTVLTSYDVAGCSAKCDAINGCAAFNIYFERDPTLDPDAANCPNPPSTTNIKCVFWGGPVTTANANNYGQTRASFQVVIAGSNGYVNQTIEPSIGYSQPTFLGNAAINAPNDCNNANTYIGMSIFTDGPFAASKCAAACSAQSINAIANPPATGNPMTCQFFNTYILLKNGASVGQYCSLYNETWSPSYATNVGQWRGNDHYTVQYSYSFSNTTAPGTCVKGAIGAY